MNKINTNKILAILYALSIYTSIFALTLENVQEQFGLFIMVLPFVIWIGCLIYNVKYFNSIERRDLFDAVILMKYMLIPMFLVGGSMIGMMLVLSIIPVPFMILVGPMTAALLAGVGWLIMMSGLVFSIPYFLKSKREQAIDSGIIILCLVCQFFFSLDVIAFMILTFKEKRWSKCTIGLICCAILLIVCFIGWIGFHLIYN